MASAMYISFWQLGAVLVSFSDVGSRVAEKIQIAAVQISLLFCMYPKGKLEFSDSLHTAS